MPGYPAHIKLVALMWTSLTLFEGSAFAQSGPSDLTSEVDALKAENAVVRELPSVSGSPAS